jgi:hypothetical protein
MISLSNNLQVYLQYPNKPIFSETSQIKNIILHYTKVRSFYSGETFKNVLLAVINEVPCDGWPAHKHRSDINIDDIREKIASNVRQATTDEDVANALKEDFNFMYLFCVCGIDIMQM